MARSELTFSLLVEEMLNHIQQPAYRQLVVELLSIVSTILGRNPELIFNQALDLEQLIKDGAHMFAKVGNCNFRKFRFNGFLQDHSLADENVGRLMEVPYVQSTGYLARAVVNNVLKGGRLSDLDGETDGCAIA